MKHKFFQNLSLFCMVVMVASLLLTGCFGLEEGDKEYTIQYSDDAGIHLITVKKGSPYSLESIPYRFGYEFLGLFSAQTDGTQYVGADGASLSTYNEKKNIVLFPHFKPIDYTVVLDYGDATVTGDRSFTVPYNTELPELPHDLTLVHSVFKGWYTEADGNGTQISDKYGNLPVVSVLNESNFKLNETKRVILYAAFDLQTYAVTFHFDGDLPTETVQVPYGTPIDKVVPKTRNNKKQAGLVWTRDADGANEFHGEVTGAMELYVKEWAPVIELNGADIPPIVARAGSSVILPEPTKPLAKFLRWETADGETASYSAMPAESVTLNAVWQGKIEFDENGGTGVTDISKAAGESVNLPAPEKEGYIFAGWYTADKELYTATKMPSEGIALKAGWYKKSEKSITLIDNNVSSAYASDSDSLTESKSISIDLSNYIKNIGEQGIKISFSIHFMWGSGNESYSGTGQIALYEGNERNSDFCLASKQLSHSRDLKYWIVENLDGTGVIHKKKLTLYYAGSSKGGPFNLTSNIKFFDMGINITYPDTTYLYL